MGAKSSGMPSPGERTAHYDLNIPLQAGRAA
jgi:hypothetical protein